MCSLYNVASGSIDARQFAEALASKHCVVNSLIKFSLFIYAADGLILQELLLWHF